jgi:hypothetical protein
VRFKTYEPFIYLIFKFFSGHGRPQITETADTESVDRGHACINSEAGKREENMLPCPDQQIQHAASQAALSLQL